MTPRTLPLFAILCALLWGAAFPLIKSVYAQWAGQDTMAVRLVFAGARFVIAGAILLPLWRNPGRTLNRRTWKPLVAMALTQTFLQYFFFYTGMAISSGVLASLLCGSGSFWWLFLAPLFLRSPKPTGRHWAVLVVCTIGIVIAVYAPGAGAGNAWFGAGLFLLAGLSGALALISIKAAGPEVDPVVATSFSLMAGGVLLLLCGISGWGKFYELLTPTIVLQTLFLAFISGTAFSLWNRLTQRFSVNVLASYRILIPLSGAILSALFVPGETLGAGIIVGGALILGSLVYLNRISIRTQGTAATKG